MKTFLESVKEKDDTHKPVVMHKHHIIPKHVGGTDDISNIKELSIESHAEAHRILWEEHGRWQDELAWKGLSKQIGKEEMLFRVSSLSSRKYWDNISADDYLHRKENAFGGNKFNREYLKLRNTLLCSKTAEIIFPDGGILIIKNIKQFCENHKLNYGNMKSVLRGERLRCSGFGGKYVTV